MSYGIMNNKRITVAQSESEEWVISKIENQVAARVMLVPSKDAILHLLITSSTSEVDADAEDLLIPPDGITLDVQRALGRISVYNSGSGQGYLYISILG